VQEALDKLLAPIDFRKTAFVLSTTKGNIELIDGGPNNSLLLHAVANKIAGNFGITEAYVVSNACTSGVMGLLYGKQLLQSRKFDHVIVMGCDVLSRFVVSGFQSLHALSDEPCKPFDATRNGLNLGEASATIILSSTHEGDFEIVGGASTNDANHISGPSRSGEELGRAIIDTLLDSQLTESDIDFISAHGTATSYNDEMESKAFHVAKVNHVPVHSLKGYFGHTLGAAGLVEIVMGLHSLKNNQLIPTKGFSALGVSKPLDIIVKPESRPLQSFLKTASGFGGCNAAVVVQKIK
jgi:3-oxoacyl-[acyl-carrier-protein] synthase-1